ncbi:MAG: hypothetical protein Q9224_006990 [Gallowayella concinna]
MLVFDKDPKGKAASFNRTEKLMRESMYYGKLKILHDKIQIEANRISGERGQPLMRQSITGTPKYEKLAKTKYKYYNVSELEGWEYLEEDLERFFKRHEEDIHVDITYVYAAVGPRSSAVNSQAPPTIQSGMAAGGAEKAAEKAAEKTRKTTTAAMVQDRLQAIADDPVAGERDALGQRLECGGPGCPHGPETSWCWVDPKGVHHKLNSLHIKRWNASIEANEGHGRVTMQEPPAGLKADLHKAHNNKVKQERIAAAEAQKGHLSPAPTPAPTPAAPAPVVVNLNLADAEGNVIRRGRQSTAPASLPPPGSLLSDPVDDSHDLEDFIQAIKLQRPRKADAFDDAFRKLDKHGWGVSSVQEWRGETGAWRWESLDIPLGIGEQLSRAVRKWSEGKLYPPKPQADTSRSLYTGGQIPQTPHSHGPGYSREMVVRNSPQGSRGIMRSIEDTPMHSHQQDIQVRRSTSTTDDGGAGDIDLDDIPSQR